MDKNKIVLFLIIFLLSISSNYGKDNNYEILLEQSIELSNKEEYDKSISLLKSIIESNPDIVNVHLNLGIVYFNKKDYENALTEFSVTIKLNPKMNLAYYFLGLIYESKLLIEENIEKKIEFTKNAIDSWEKFIELFEKEDNKTKIAKKHLKMLIQNLSHTNDKN